MDRNELAWLEDSLELVKFVDEEGTMVAKIHNRGGYPVPFNITAPVYIHVTPDRGNWLPMKKKRSDLQWMTMLPLETTLIPSFCTLRPA